jgi:hypothetical protein
MAMPQNSPGDLQMFFPIPLQAYFHHREVSVNLSLVVFWYIYFVRVFYHIPEVVMVVFLDDRRVSVDAFVNAFHFN